MPARPTVVSACVARRICALALALAAVGSAAACTNDRPAVAKPPQSGSATASAVGGVQQLTITSGTDLRFHPSTLVVHRGQVRIVLDNTSKPGAGPPHNLQVTGLPAASVPLVQAGEKATVTFTAPAPGRYEFVCTIHEEEGQTGVMIVRPGTGP